MGNLIAINATAATTSGALTIIKNFLNEIVNSDLKIIIFCCADLTDFKSDTITIVQFPIKGYISRIIWDYYYFQKYLVIRGLTPSIIISFQNTGLIYDRSIPQLIYYHNPMPFSKRKWNPLLSNERIIWFYKRIYPFFIKNLIRTNTYYIVQAEWIKTEFVKMFHVKDQNIRVIKPTVNINKQAINNKEIKNDSENLIFLYPATAFVYKNHKLILQALVHLKKHNKLLFDKLIIFFTIELHDIIALNLTTLYDEVSDRVHLMGHVDEKTIWNTYRLSDAILFPSLIETFGLPLIEATMLDKPIFCADEKYAFETLKGYKNVKFINSENYKLWAEELITFSKVRTFYQENTKKIDVEINSWEMVNIFIKEIMENKYLNNV